eukprot:Skav204027  [mRNA]  locus=scaffold574:8222:9304:- [translate_table: standard]
MRPLAPSSDKLEILLRFQWVEQTHYLRRPFGYNLDVDALANQAIQLIYAAWGKLKPVLKRCHWSRTARTAKMLDQYIGNETSLLWLSPLLFPYSTFRTRLRRVQATLMIEALNLYMPDLDEAHAHQLLRIRRHVVKAWILNMAPSGSWEHQHLRRYWSFLGHICRQTFASNHPAKVMLHHLMRQHSETLSRPGPWNTPHSLVSKFWRTSGFEGDHIHMASDREAWKSLTPCFLHWHGLQMNPINVEMLEANPWEAPKYLLRATPAWLQIIFIAVHGGTLAAVWLDKVEGFMVWKHRSGQADAGSTTVSNSLQELCVYLSMLSRPFLLQFAVPQVELWTAIQDHAHELQEMFMRCSHASWS